MARGVESEAHGLRVPGFSRVGCWIPNPRPSKARRGAPPARGIESLIHWVIGSLWTAWILGEQWNCSHSRLTREWGTPAGELSHSVIDSLGHCGQRGFSGEQWIFPPRAFGADVAPRLGD